jgi:heme A synthase
MQLFDAAAHLLLVHVALATIVVALALLTGVRAWGLYGRDLAPLRRLGLGLIALAAIQVLLGLASLVVTGSRFDVQSWPTPSTLEVIITTSHQTAGAVMLAVATAVALWVRREPTTDSRQKTLQFTRL